jgi:hypothetical protein
MSMVLLDADSQGEEVVVLFVTPGQSRLRSVGVSIGAGKISGTFQKTLTLNNVTAEPDTLHTQCVWPRRK